MAERSCQASKCHVRDFAQSCRTGEPPRAVPDNRRRPVQHWRTRQFGVSHAGCTRAGRSATTFAGDSAMPAPAAPERRYRLARVDGSRSIMKTSLGCNRWPGGASLAAGLRSARRAQQPRNVGGRQQRRKRAHEHQRGTRPTGRYRECTHGGAEAAARRAGIFHRARRLHARPRSRRCAPSSTACARSRASMAATRSTSSRARRGSPTSSTSRRPSTAASPASRRWRRPHYLLGEIRVYSLNARNPLKGQGQQLLHSDVPRVTPNDWRVVNSMVMLDDMTETTARPASSPARTNGSRSTCPT